MKNSDKLLDQAGLQAIALRYVSRYATTRHKLIQYLTRKLKEKGWSESLPADLEALAERFSENGYIDDAQYAESKALSLVRRGYGQQRLKQALYQSGISEEDSQVAIEISEKQKWLAAEKFAKKKAIGPFAMDQADRDKSQKQLAAFMRAGHSYDLASRFVFAKPGDQIDELVY